MWYALNSSYRTISVWPVQLTCYICDILGGSLSEITWYLHSIKYVGHRVYSISHLRVSAISKYILLPYGNYQKGLQIQFLLILRWPFSNAHNIPASQKTIQTSSLFFFFYGKLSPRQFSFRKYNLYLNYGNIIKHHSWFIQFSITSFLKISAPQEYLKSSLQWRGKITSWLSAVWPHRDAFKCSINPQFSPTPSLPTNSSGTCCPTHYFTDFSIWKACIWKRHLTTDFKVTVYCIYRLLKCTKYINFEGNYDQFGQLFTFWIKLVY